MSLRTRIVSSASGTLGLAGLAWIVGGCCGVPWLVALVGVSGAVTLARLAPAAPYLWAVAAVLMAATAWWTFRPRRACADGSCERPLSWPLRWLTVLVAVGAIILFVVSQPWKFW
ncbi:MAG: hypothetical protein JSS45_08425 [Proteobacteria bacterium]|nr:hypothetical protein [Pseudomonadota bacterium]MBS0598850.1 hypothetical protein [Pseudomonadota bacterium]